MLTLFPFPIRSDFTSRLLTWVDYHYTLPGL